jgi:glucokinase
MGIENANTFCMGIDVGGTNIVCGLVASDGVIVQKLKRSTEAGRGSLFVIERIAAMINETIEHSGVNREQIIAVGVGTPGLVDPFRGISIHASNLGWKGIPLAAELEHQLNLPVFIDNDVRMYVYGEALYGAGEHHNHVLGVTLGTGLACAFVNEGQFFYGGGFLAGELGHISHPDIDYDCACGNRGCLETAVSALGMVRQAIEKLNAGQDSILRIQFPDERYAQLTSAIISEGYDQGDDLCVEVMNRTGQLLGHGLAIAATMYSPDIIVVGGGASLAGERLLAPARKQIQRELLPDLWRRLTIVRAALIDDAGVVGSAMNARQRIQ